MSNERLQEVLENLKFLKDDDVSKRFKEKTEQVIEIINSNQELVIEKALLELEEIHSLEIPSYHRTQVWDIISMLESMKSNV